MNEKCIYIKNEKIKKFFKTERMLYVFICNNKRINNT